MPNELTLTVDKSLIDSIQQVADQVSLPALEAFQAMEQSFRMAAGIERLNQLITEEMMAPVMQLQNTSLGFRTDKQQGGYPLPIVKRCCIEASVYGARWTGNEFNIIAGNVYLTKQYFVRALREMAGLAGLKIDYGVPTMKNGGAIVSAKAAWKFQDTPDSLEREIPIKVNQGMGVDAILGKADRKMRAAIYGQITGRGDAVPEGQVDDVANGQPKVSKSNLDGKLFGNEAEPAKA